MRKTANFKPPILKHPHRVSLGNQLKHPQEMPIDESKLSVNTKSVQGERLKGLQSDRSTT